MEARRVAFYAPLKSPHHPSPSGDRTMARLLMKALAAAGFEPGLASALRTFDKAGDRAVQERIRTESEEEADRLIAAYRALPGERPSLWFTYHVYYKAPDWIGPRVADALGIPYLIAEGSRAGKRAGGPWDLGHAGAEAALDRADAIFVMTDTDREALERAEPDAQRLIDLRPFSDVNDWRLDGCRSREERSSQRFLTVAMMRHGDKLASYGILADALGRLGESEWTLDVVGDGDARTDVERLFSRFGSRIRFHGQIDNRAQLAGLYGQADIFLWPAVNEAYGLVFLEAQAFGCPVVAGAYGGVPSVVRGGETGVLTSRGDPAAFADAVIALAEDRERSEALGAAAKRFVAEERGLRQAAETLRSVLAPLVTGEKTR